MAEITRILEAIDEGDARAAEELLPLDKLASEHATKAELVKLRYFVGLTEDEAAAVLKLSRSTAKRHWAFASAWLCREIDKSDA